MSSSERLTFAAAELQPPIHTLEAAMQPLVEDVFSDVTSFNGAALFIPDNWHQNSADVVALVHSPDLSNERREFADINIRQHRVDLAATALRNTFVTRQSDLTGSRMNKNHVVWGAHMTPGNNASAVMQFAFDTSTRATLPTPEYLETAWQRHRVAVVEATEAVILSGASQTSLADTLLLESPVTPNAYVIKWDVTKSTNMVRQNYPLFRNYLYDLQSSVNQSVEQSGGRIVTYSGDGQNIVLDIPAPIDRADLSSVGSFGRDAAAPLVGAIIEAHRRIAPEYALLRPNIRVGLGLGHTELSQAGEETGSIFWDVAEAVESIGRNKTASQTTRMARLALLVASTK